MLLEPSISPVRVRAAQRKTLPRGGTMTAAAAPILVPNKAKAVDSARADERRHVRTAFTFLAPSLLGVILFLLIPISLGMWLRAP